MKTDVIRERAIRGGPVLDLSSNTPPASPSFYGAEFDRWLSAELATAERTGAERALREAARILKGEFEPLTNREPNWRNVYDRLIAALIPSERKSDQ